MPVSHLALTVSNLADATSFYLKALQPLGYRYCGRQGDAIGFGVTDADFFICQENNGRRVTPTHIAFAAKNRLIVRECYAAALNAGGGPSGPPNYRNDDCSCFNAAIEDFDGNTIEFIFRESSEPDKDQVEQAFSRYREPRDQRNDGHRDETRNYVDTVTSFANRAHSTARTALDLASSASQSYKKSSAPTPGIKRSRTEPLTPSDNAGGKTVVGTLLGAAAGAAVAYAMVRSERDSAMEEAKFASSMRARDSRSTTSRYPAPRTIQAPIARPQIEAPPTRTPLSRSRTYDATDYKPRSSSLERVERFSMKRASTMPTEFEDSHRSKDKHYSRYNSSRRRSVDDTRSSRHDSGVGMRSHRPRRSSFSKTSSVKPSKRTSRHDDSAANIALPSSRGTAYHTMGEQTPRASKSRSYVSAAEIPLPQSRTPSYLNDTSIRSPPFDYGDRYTAFVDEESDGLGDLETVVPDDSISCVDFSRSSKKKGSGRKDDVRSKSSRLRSEVDSERTVRQGTFNGRGSLARTLPLRGRDDGMGSRNGGRSAATYA